MIIDIFAHIILFFYCISILLIFFYSLAQLNLLFNYLKSKKNKKNLDQFNFSNPDEIPFITIQLPIYNEKYVVEGLLQCISKLEYPREKLQIQVLDDSTDDSLKTTKKLVDFYIAKGFNISQITRVNRVGYKAGALKEGLTQATGEFIAIFDADFLPETDWLQKTVPYFKNNKVGVVQTRWGHINRNYSILTQIQAFALDAHFTLEQTGRNSKKHFINFNGTAGLWRKTCIIDAGNWEADTLTEDLDLSYRAQLKNWEFVYLEDVVTPAELPAVLSAARSQQFRWNKGGAENFVKMFKRVTSSENISFKTKIHGVLHLLNSSMFLCIFTMAIFSVPMLYIKNTYGHLKIFFDVLSLFFLTTLIFFICYWNTYKNIYKNTNGNFLKYVKLFFTFYTIAMGFSFQNTLAVIEGLMGKKSEFVRTPKLNVNNLKETFKNNTYLSKKISKKTIIEGLLIMYFGFGLYSGFYFNDYVLFPFHIMLIIGYGFVFIKSIKVT